MKKLIYSSAINRRFAPVNKSIIIQFYCEVVVVRWLTNSELDFLNLYAEEEGENILSLSFSQSHLNIYDIIIWKRKRFLHHYRGETECFFVLFFF